MNLYSINFEVRRQVRIEPGITVPELHQKLRHHTEYSIRSCLCRLRDKKLVYSAAGERGILGYWADEPPVIDFSDVPQTWLHRPWGNITVTENNRPKWC